MVATQPSAANEFESKVIHAANIFRGLDRFICLLDGKGLVVYNPRSGELSFTLYLIEAVDAYESDWKQLASDKLWRDDEWHLLKKL